MKQQDFEDEVAELPDQLNIAIRVKNLFKRSDGEGGCLSYVTKIVEIPLTFIRDLTIPMADNADWNRNRATVLPLTIPVSLFYL